MDNLRKLTNEEFIRAFSVMDGSNACRACRKVYKEGNATATFNWWEHTCGECGYWAKRNPKGPYARTSGCRKYPTSRLEDPACPDCVLRPPVGDEEVPHD